MAGKGTPRRRRPPRSDRAAAAARARKEAGGDGSGRQAPGRRGSLRLPPEPEREGQGRTGAYVATALGAVGGALGGAALGGAFVGTVYSASGTEQGTAAATSQLVIALAGGVGGAGLGALFVLRVLTVPAAVRTALFTCIGCLVALTTVIVLEVDVPAVLLTAVAVSAVGARILALRTTGRTG